MTFDSDDPPDAGWLTPAAAARPGADIQGSMIGGRELPTSSDWLDGPQGTNWTPQRPPPGTVTMTTMNSYVFYEFIVLL